MTMSLRDQLLQAGLATERQSKDAERQLRQQQRERQQQPKAKRALPSTGQLAVQQAQLTKAARDLELSRQNIQQADEKARQAQIAQLIEQHRLPRAQTDERYNFVDGTKVRHVPADQSVRERLNRRQIAIVRHHAVYELVPAEIAARIRKRDKHAVIECSVADGAATTDGVPEDLIW